MFRINSLTPYIFVFWFLYLMILIYFRVAEYYNIVDKPNQRSSHSEITIRGGGIIFPIAVIVYSIFFNQTSLILIAGLLAISLISFLDDIMTLPISTRMFVHLLSVTTLVYVLDGFQTWPLFAIPMVYILVIGCINAYNFMDGINGITGLYSAVLFGSAVIVNQTFRFTDANFIIMGMLSCIVFLFFNFRKRAKCFAGDVGSVSIAFWLISILAMMIVRTADLKYFLFLAVYGVDAVLTIAHRLILKQRIFDAHRLHFYQILANENKIPHIAVAALYAAIQLIINLIVIYGHFSLFTLLIITLLPLCVAYLLFKKRLMHNL